MAVNQSPRLLVLGGGFTLERFASTLDPSEFVITTRSIEKYDAWVGRGWNASRLDLEDADSIGRLMRAYPSLRIIIDGVPPLKGDRPDRGVAAVCQVLTGTAIERIMYLSTTGVFGVSDGSWVDESTPAAPSHPQSSARLESENRYRSSGCRTLVLRLPAIYGRGRGVDESLRRGTYRLIDNGENWTNRIHVDDLVSILRSVLEVNPAIDLLCISDDEPAKARDVVEFVCSRTGLPWPVSISREEARAQGAFTLLSNQRIKNSLMKTTLALTLQFPSYKQGMLRKSVPDSKASLT